MRAFWYGFAIRVAVGLTLGSLIGIFLAGDLGYLVLLCVGLPLAIVGFVFLASWVRSERRAKPAPEAAPRGIIATMAASTATGRPVSTGSTDSTDSATASGVPIWRRLLALPVIVLSAALVLIPGYQMIGWTVSDTFQGRPFDGRDMRTGLHLQGAVDALMAASGGTVFTDINFYDSYVIADAPTTPGANTTDEFMWQSGHANRDGPELIQSDDLQTELFDASQIDFSIIPDLVRKSEADTGWTGFTSMYPGVRRDFDGGAPRIYISLGTDYFDATYTYSIDGELISRSGDVVQ